jgi:hypothetical protein
MVSKIISLVMPEQQLAQLDLIRGDVPRSAYVRRLIDKALENANKKRGVKVL